MTCDLLSSFDSFVYIFLQHVEILGLYSIWNNCEEVETFSFRLIFFEEIATYTVLDSTLNLVLNPINNLQDSLFWKYTDF